MNKLVLLLLILSCGQDKNRSVDEAKKLEIAKQKEQKRLEAERLEKKKKVEAERAIKLKELQEEEAKLFGTITDENGVTKVLERVFDQAVSNSEIMLSDQDTSNSESKSSEIKIFGRDTLTERIEARNRANGGYTRIKSGRSEPNLIYMSLLDIREEFLDAKDGKKISAKRSLERAILDTRSWLLARPSENGAPINSTSYEGILAAASKKWKIKYEAFVNNIPHHGKVEEELEQARKKIAVQLKYGEIWVEEELIFGTRTAYEGRGFPVVLEYIFNSKVENEKIRVLVFDQEKNDLMPREVDPKKPDHFIRLNKSIGVIRQEWLDSVDKEAKDKVEIKRGYLEKVILDTQKWAEDTAWLYTKAVSDKEKEKVIAEETFNQKEREFILNIVIPYRKAKTLVQKAEEKK